MTGTYVCVDSKTPLVDIASDGARCGRRTHFHPRLGSGFAGAQRVAGPNRYEELAPAPPPELPTTNGTSEGGEP